MATESREAISADIEAYYAMKLLDSGDHSGAIATCVEALAKFGPSRNCYLIKARAHLKLDEYGFAEEALQSLLGLDPEHPAAWVLLGELYYRLGKELHVEYCRERLENIFPALAELLDEKTARGIPAESHGELAVQLRHESADSLSSKQPVQMGQEIEKLIQEEVRSKQPEDGYSASQREDSELPGSPEAEQTLVDRPAGLKSEIFETATFADICFNQGKYDKALKVYRKLLANDPDNTRLMEKIKLIESKMGA